MVIYPNYIFFFYLFVWRSGKLRMKESESVKKVKVVWMGYVRVNV